jgi:hypothetical protein
MNIQKFLKKYSHGMGNLNNYGEHVEDRYYIAAAIPEFGEGANPTASNEAIITATASLRKFIILILILLFVAFYSVKTV